MRATTPSRHLRESAGRQTVRFRISRLRRMTSRPFGLTTADTADTAVMLGDESSSTGLAAEIRAAVSRAPVVWTASACSAGTTWTWPLPSAR